MLMASSLERGGLLPTPRAATRGADLTVSCGHASRQQKWDRWALVRAAGRKHGECVDLGYESHNEGIIVFI